MSGMAFAIRYGKLKYDESTEWEPIIGKFHAHRMVWTEITQGAYEWRYGNFQEDVLIFIIASILIADKEMGEESLLDLVKRLIEYVEVTA